MLGVGPEKAIKLGTNDYLRDRFAAENLQAGKGSKLEIWQEITAASIAGTLQVTVTNPYELLKIRKQMNHQKAVSAQIKELGISGLYMGTSATLLRDIPFTVVFFPLYAHLRTVAHGMLNAKGDGSLRDTVGTIGAGMLSGALSAAAVTPFDVVKTRIQAEGGKEKYGSVANCARTIASGPSPLATFYKGVVPRFIVIGTLYGISMGAFELLKLQFEKENAVTKAERSH